MLLQILMFVFLLIIAMFVLTAVILHRLFHQLGLNQIFNLFRGKTKGEHRRQGTSKQTHWGKRQTQTPSGITIIDHRTPEKVNQKIFQKDEGEYVDFEEV